MGITQQFNNMGQPVSQMTTNVFGDTDQAPISLDTQGYDTGAGGMDLAAMMSAMMGSMPQMPQIQQPIDIGNQIAQAVNSSVNRGALGTQSFSSVKRGNYS